MTEHDTPTQLSLLPSSEVPVRLRLDDATRRRGLRHIAEIRREMEARKAAKAREQQHTTRVPVRAA
jgi:hypothetical protein